MYPPGSEIRVVPGRAADRWEGAARPGHFAGVLTVVAKLFHLAEPDVACFGRKDVQQTVLIRQMVRDLDWPIELAVVPTVREPDGLALSSRNVYLDPEQRRRATALSGALQEAHVAWRGGRAERRGDRGADARGSRDVSRGRRSSTSRSPSPRRWRPVTEVSATTVVALAARVGLTRLIDNIVLGEGSRLMRTSAEDAAGLAAHRCRRGRSSSPARREHIERVAELAAPLGAARWACPSSERHRWLRAVWLHDALRDAPEEELERWAPSTPGPPELRHGPASAARAKAEGETDRGVLDAVRYHSIGLAEWDMVGRMLYCADYLEPGRKLEREWRAELAARLPARARRWCCARWPASRLGHMVSSGWPASRTDGPLLEQSRRRVLRIVLIGARGARLPSRVRLLVPPPPAERGRARRTPFPSPDQRITVEVLNGTRRAGRGPRRHPACCAARDSTWCSSAMPTRRSDSTRVIVRRGDPARGPRRARGARRGPDRGRARHAAAGGCERDSGRRISGRGGMLHP